VFVETGEFALLSNLLQGYYGLENVRLRLHACYDTEFLVWRGKLIDYINRFLIRRYLQKTDVIVATNSYHLKFAVRYYLNENKYRCARKRLILFPNAVDLRPGNKGKSDNVIDKMNVSGRKDLFLTLGRMDRDDDLAQKGFEDVIDALYLLKALDQSLVSDLCLVFVGRGRKRAMLENKSKQLGLTMHVHFIDAVSRDDVFQLIKSVKACILASRYEGYSMFAAEVVANGGILIGTRETGLEDIVDDGVNGFLFNPHSAVELAQRLRTVLLLSEDQLSCMRSASRLKVSASNSFGTLEATLKLLWS